MEAKPKLLDTVREKIRSRHYSLRTERAYLDWIRRFILFHEKRHPSELSAHDVERFLTHLAVDRHVASSTQNQALAAILFLYRDVLEIELPWVENVVRALTAMVSRLICLAGGVFVGDGAPATVLADPAVREVFLGTEVTAALAGGSLEPSSPDGERGEP